MTDILDTIDETLGSLDLCACGCGQRLTEGSASPWYAGEACQLRWMERGKHGFLPERARSSRRLLLDVEPAVRQRLDWPSDAPSVLDLMPHIVTWLNANGIPAIDVPMPVVPQLHDGQITVWTFERPRRIVDERAVRRLVTVPMVVAPPDVLQPWLRGECRESVPFVSGDTVAVDAVLRNVASVDPANFADEFVTRLRAEDVTHSDEHFRRFYLNEPVCSEAGVAPVDAALDPPVRWSTAGADRETVRRPWWRIW